MNLFAPRLFTLQSDGTQSGRDHEVGFCATRPFFSRSCCPKGKAVLRGMVAAAGLDALVLIRIDLSFAAWLVPR